MEVQIGLMEVKWTVTSAIVAWVAWMCLSYYTSPLRKYPGPYIAGWTNLWRFRLAIKADCAKTPRRLHDKYGPVIRLGPNLLDLDMPELAKVIYGTDGKWQKSDFYNNSSSTVNGTIIHGIFGEQDSVAHAKMKRPVVNHYTIPSVRATEPLMDDAIRDFCQHLQDRFVTTGETCPLGDWLSFCAWDFLGLVLFSKKFGYMDKGFDFDGTMAISDQSIDYLGICGQMPWLDAWLDKNPIYPLGPPNLANATKIAVDRLMARLKGEDTNFKPENPDFMQYFIESREKHPDVVDETMIIMYVLTNLVAGADTTAIVLKSVFYYCLKDPRIWKKLEDEVRSNFSTGTIAPIAESRQLPYLEAVVNEALRYHPPVCMTMERVVPKSGLSLPDGSFVPAGTLVGMNPYVVGRNKDIYGDDAEAFRPERWLQQDDESYEAFKVRQQKWSHAQIAFGGGSRICLGRNLSVMEVYKIVATLIAHFDIELEDPEELWWTSARWFHRTKGVKCRIRPRTV